MINQTEWSTGQNDQPDRMIILLSQIYTNEILLESWAARYNINYYKLSCSYSI